jgi:hypothetical protein
MGCGIFTAIYVAFVPRVAAQMIPSISGRVADAVTGEPVTGVNVALHARRYEGFSVYTILNDDKLTGQSGDFQFSGSVQSVREDQSLLSGFKYWLTVNTDKGDSTGTDENTDQDVFYNPMGNRHGQSVGNKKYFPLTIEFTPEACTLKWNATCVYENPTSGLYIRLVPVLNDVEDCKKIRDSSLQERCWQLNTYRAAFVHVDTYEQVQKGKELCNTLKYPQISQPCLDQLARYVANPAYDRPIKPQVKVPTPPGMFPDSIAGLPVMNNGHCGPQLEFDGVVECAGGYGTVSRQLVAVYFERWPENTPKLKEWSHLDPTAKWSHLQDPEVNEEVRGGGKVLRYLGKTYSGVQGVDGSFVQTEHKATSYVWFSANTIVEVLFYDPMPQQEAFLSYYLGKFPSTSK